MNSVFERLRNLDGVRSAVASLPSPRDPRLAMRIVLGLLVVLNLVALWMVMSPPGGSVEELETALIARRAQYAQAKAALARVEATAKQVESVRADEDKFQAQYFTSRRVASSTFVSELVQTAKRAGIRPKEHAFLFEQIEGSDTLSMMTITANYEGTYADLLHFVNELDRSSRFLIIDTLGAQPQGTTGLLNVQLKLNAFVRETGPSVPVAAAQGGGGQ